ncbi:MAG: radical SAM protein [Candidatus Lokiarchaeota archaeon]|nr:radical SAM protein [Candidatus Lokiarchaeota archaeon]
MTSTYKLKTCIWELTLKCNMRCLHCGSKAGIDREHELNLDECLSIADELLELNCNLITLIGGEVFLYPGWEQIARKLSDGGSSVNIITNGYLMGKKQIREIKNAKLLNVGISLDGMRDNHNKIRNNDRSFDRVLKAFQLLNKENIPIGVVTTLLDFNFPDLEEMYDLLLEYDIPIWQLQIAHPMGNLEDKEIVLNPSKMPKLTSFIKEKRYKGKITVYAGDNIGYYDSNEAYIRNVSSGLSVWEGCQAGLSVIGIDSVGNVKGCESIYSDEFIEGNLRNQSLAKIWNDPHKFAYNRKFDINDLEGNCKDCEFGKICKAGCRASNLFCTGNLYNNYFCRSNI